MAIKHLLTSFKFTTLQWGDVMRCAVSSAQDFRGAHVDVEQLEARVLYSASPLPVESAAVEEADTVDQSTTISQDNSQSPDTDAPPDDIRTTDDSLALLDELTLELLPAGHALTQQDLVFAHTWLERFDPTQG